MTMKQVVNNTKDYRFAVKLVDLDLGISSVLNKIYSF